MEVRFDRRVSGSTQDQCPGVLHGGVRGVLGLGRGNAGPGRAGVDGGANRTGAQDVPSAGRLLRDLGGEPPAFPHVRKYVQPGEAADRLAGIRERLGDRELGVWTVRRR
jgi:hypothetical protein